jgi:Xaa-Pro aminopeptidase
VTSVKDKEEIECLKIAAKFTEFVFKNLIDNVENDIED